MKVTLKAARVNAGIGQRDAAERLGLNIKTLLAYENGERYPRVDTVKKMQELYHVHYDDINFLLPEEAV